MTRFLASAWGYFHAIRATVHEARHHPDLSWRQPFRQEFGRLPVRLWKREIQRLRADQTGFTITIAHLALGTSNGARSSAAYSPTPPRTGEKTSCQLPNHPPTHRRKHTNDTSLTVTCDIDASSCPKGRHRLRGLDPRAGSTVSSQAKSVGPLAAGPMSRMAGCVLPTGVDESGRIAVHPEPA